MFVMRKAQLDSLGQTAGERFEDRMVLHLRNRFEQECRELGEEAVRDRIRDGIKRAARYEIRAERDVSRFIRFMFGIRPDFDTSRKTKWAGPILKDTNLVAGERLSRIKTVAREQRVRRGV